MTNHPIHIVVRAKKGRKVTACGLYGKVFRQGTPTCKNCRKAWKARLTTLGERGMLLGQRRNLPS